MKILGRLLICLFVVALLVLFFYWIIFPEQSPSWTGFGPSAKLLDERSKTLWDWLDLLIIPVFLAIGIWWLNKRNEKNKENIEAERQNHEKLEKYYDCITNLLLHEDLKNEGVKPEVLEIARIKTLSLLRTIDGSRKGQLLQFLVESKLIEKNPIINLNGANFNDASLSGANLQGIEIRGAYFKEADFNNANLKGAKFQGCDFSGANFQKCTIEDADLSQAKLNKAILTDVDFQSAILWATTFDEAKMNNVRFGKNQENDIGSMKNAKGKWEII